MAKPIPKQPNVFIPSPDDESDEIQTIAENETMPAKKAAKKESAGKGKKYCPNCGKIIAARANSHECGWVKDPSETPRTPSAKRKAIDSNGDPKIALLKVLKGRGFDVKGTQDIFDPKAELSFEFEKALNPLMDLVPNYNANGKFELSLDQVLTMLKIPLSK